MIRVIFTTRTFYCRTVATLRCARYKVIQICSKLVQQSVSTFYARVTR